MTVSQLRRHGATFVALLALVLMSGAAFGAEVPLITGEHWTKSSEQVKKAYLIGVANALQVENAYQLSSPPSDAQSLVPTFARGIKGQTLDTVRDGLDKWYAAHPNDLDRPVIETIWFEMVVPGLQKASAEVKR